MVEGDKDGEEFIRDYGHESVAELRACMHHKPSSFAVGGSTAAGFGRA